MKENLRKYWYLWVIAILLPPALYFLVSLPWGFDAIGSGDAPKEWLGFWGGYLGAIISTGAAFYILNRQLKQNHKENEDNRIANKTQNSENKNLQLNILKYQQEMRWLEGFRSASIKYVTAINHNNFASACNMLLEQPEKIFDITKDMIDAEFAAFCSLELYQKKDVGNHFDIYEYINERRLRFLRTVKDVHLTGDNMYTSNSNNTSLKKAVESREGYSDEFLKLMDSAPVGDGTELHYKICICRTITTRVGDIQPLQKEMLHNLQSYILKEQERINNILLENSDGAEQIAEVRDGVDL